MQSVVLLKAVPSCPGLGPAFPNFKVYSMGRANLSKYFFNWKKKIADCSS